MKKRIIVLLLSLSILLTGCTLNSCSYQDIKKELKKNGLDIDEFIEDAKTDIKESAIHLNHKELYIGVGKSQKLSLLYCNKKVKWEVENNKKVSIKKVNDNTIEITGKKKGNTSVVAKFRENGKEYTCKINVINTPSEYKKDFDFNYVSSKYDSSKKPEECKDYKLHCYYDDKYFYHSAWSEKKYKTYNSNLSTASLCFAMSSFCSNEGGIKDYSKKYKNAFEYLINAGFEKNSISYNEWYTKKPETNSIGVIAGNKIFYDKKGNKSTLIAVAVRGGGYEREWVGNVTLGTKGQHEGFNISKMKVISFLKEYISNQKITGKVKLWITGYSRAGVTANLVAGAINDGYPLGNVEISKNDLYAYCFEPPIGSLKTEVKNENKYNNIYNIINPNDIVTKVAMSEYGFKRYGTDCFLPERANDSDYEYKLTQMLNYYREINDKLDAHDEIGEYIIDDFELYKIDIDYLSAFSLNSIFQKSNNYSSQAVVLDKFMSRIATDGIKNRNEYVTNFQESIKTICYVCFGGEEKDLIDKLCEKLNSKESLEDFLVAFTFHGKNGIFNSIKSKITDWAKENNISNLKESDIDNLAKGLSNLFKTLLRNSTLFAAVGINYDKIFPAHYPELCLSWMMCMDSNYSGKKAISHDWNGDYRIISVNCPVDVFVYNSEKETIAKIENEQAKTIKGSKIISIINDEGEKVVYLPADEKYTVELEATGDGTMNCSIQEFAASFGKVSRIDNYNNINIQKNDKFKWKIESCQRNSIGKLGSNNKYELKKTSESNIIKTTNTLKGKNIQNNVVVVKIDKNIEEGGIIEGGGSEFRGECVGVRAQAKAGYHFEGWYNKDKKISEDENYKFVATDNILLTARFEEGEAFNSVIARIFKVYKIHFLILFIVLVLVATIVLYIMKRKKKHNHSVQE